MQVNMCAQLGYRISNGLVMTHTDRSIEGCMEMFRIPSTANTEGINFDFARHIITPIDYQFVTKI